MGCIFQRTKVKNFKSSKGVKTSKPVNVMAVTNEISNCRVVVTKFVNNREYRNNSNPEVVKIREHNPANTWMGR